jgi:hypothetical protein
MGVGAARRSFARALAELEQARALAPDSTVVALHLAAAYPGSATTPARKRCFAIACRRILVTLDSTKRLPRSGRSSR